MDVIPEEWIDRLFGCMYDFYGERWTGIFKSEYHKALHKTVWRNGLYGLKYDQIKMALKYYRWEAGREESKPPTVMRFYRYASEIRPSA